MIALEIENIKELMVQLFQGEMFDKFHVNRCEATTFVTFTVDGKVNASWLDSDEEEDGERFVEWRKLKPLMFSFIRGKKTPQKLQIDFCHYMTDGDMGSLRIQYGADGLFVYSGYMQREFLPGHDKQQAWDENCLQFIKRNGIVGTQL